MITLKMTRSAAFFVFPRYTTGSNRRGNGAPLALGAIECGDDDIRRSGDRLAGLEVHPHTIRMLAK